VVHYVFVVWAQYMLVDNQTPAFIKAAMVFVTTVCASWLVSAVVSAFWNNRRTKQIKPKTL
jgi:glucans biosynthesis protein C